MKRALQNDEVQSCETKQPKLEVPADDESNQKLEKENHDERSEQPLQISRIGADNETKREENHIEEVDTRSTSVTSWSEDFTRTIDASRPVEEQKDEIEKFIAQLEELSSWPPSLTEDFTPISVASRPIEGQKDEIEKFIAQLEELSSWAPSSSKDFTPTSDASKPVEEQKDEILKFIAQLEELSSWAPSSSEDFTSTSDALRPVEEQQENEIEQIARKAVTEEQVRLSPREYYFHYTPFSAMAKIRSDGFLKPSTPYYKGNIGMGIYVTSMNPFTNSSWELRRDLFKGGGSPITKSKLQCFFALRKTDVDAACAIQQYPGRPECVRLVPKKSFLFLSDVDHYSGYRPSGGDSD